MIPKHSFLKLISLIEDYNNSIFKLEDVIDQSLENSWLSHIVDNLIRCTSESFFSTVPEDINIFRVEMIEALIHHFCWMREEQPIIYKRGDIKIDVTTTETLYDVIVDYMTHIDKDVEFNI